MLNKLRAFMAGRNGSDQLCLALVVVSFIFSLLSGLFEFLYLVSLAAIIMALFRVFSKNLTKRREENARFVRIWTDIKGSFTAWRERRAQSGQFKFFACPSCKNRLRVPRGKGKIQITCPVCGQRFSGKS